MKGRQPPLRSTAIGEQGGYDCWPIRAVCSMLYAADNTSDIRTPCAAAAGVHTIKDDGSFDNS
jgi:hypothetical protein